MSHVFRLDMLRLGGRLRRWWCYWCVRRAMQVLAEVVKDYDGTGGLGSCEFELRHHPR